MEPVGHEANGFGRRYLHVGGARLVRGWVHGADGLPPTRHVETHRRRDPNPASAARRGTNRDDPPDYYGELMPEQQSDPIGTLTTTSSGGTSSGSVATLSWCNTRATAHHRSTRAPPAERSGGLP
jgi:hypothetical protein